MARQSQGTTIRDVARVAGVSAKTVSNVLNGYQYIRPETKARVEAAMRELNYHVNVSARNLSLGRTGAIALVVPSLRGVYFADLADSVVREADARGFTVFVVQTDDDRSREMRVLGGEYRAQFDGVLYSPLALGQADSALFDVDFPMVLLGERVFNAGLDHVTMDNIAGSRAATEHVLQAGARVVVPLGIKDDASASSGTLRFEGFKQALASHGMQVDQRALFGVPDYFHQTGMSTMARVLDAGVRPDAVVAFTDTLALGALSTLHERGLRVPEDVLLTGFDNIDEGQYSLPPLTTIDPSREWIAQEAVRLLDERIQFFLDGVPKSAQPQARTAVAGFSLVERRSTHR